MCDTLHLFNKVARDIKHNEWVQAIYDIAERNNKRDEETRFGDDTK